MPNNMILLETIALTQSAASVTFDNLPTSGYTDLKIVASARDNRSAVASDFIIGFNGVTTNLSFRRLYGDGSSAISTSGSFGSAGIEVANTATASTFSNVEITIPNYRSSNFKSYSVDSVSENNATTAYAQLTAGLWSNTAAITSITFTAESSASFLANSTFSLYGIAALGTTPVLAPKATGGNIVANDGTYWYHAFTSSGNFVPQVGLTADVLQVAGGGSAGSNQRGGGGGAGGLLTFTSQAFVSGTNYAATVGAGGPATASVTIKGNNGSDSQLGALTASVGGGAGASGGGGDANTGGSGGGVSYYNFTGPNGTTGQGNKGGNTTNSWPVSSGGGGAGGAGGDSRSSSTGGLGGVGATSSLINAMGAATLTGELSGGNYYYAGGGGGGSDGTATVNAGGLGGGGDGRTPPGEAGTANTGGGGGGGSFISPSFAAGGAGGSGVIIIRYPIA
jgi:hypothetical protein